MKKNMLLLMITLLLSACSSNIKQLDKVEFIVIKSNLNQNAIKNIDDLNRDNSIHLSEKDIIKTTLRKDNSILLEISPRATDSLWELTKKHVGEQIIVLIDGKINSIAKIQEPISTQFIIIAAKPKMKAQ
ncbi:hypothetical protein [Photobacterium damselae]|uniref:hypothetical protein n=1 Tax=Photobacterium damselae TaxID=38293 RepID=UPI001F1DD7B7|nr:hypothetical protein [Photobacterium damselae]UKA11702.1 hypothetical protein IHC91_18135 [Photobacterium damselae subsp. damselae]